jgi:hypothetical protein
VPFEAVPITRAPASFASCTAKTPTPPAAPPIRTVSPDCRPIADRAAADAVTHAEALDAGSDLVDHPSEVISEAGRRAHTEHRGQFGLCRDARIHGIETDRGHADSDLSRTGVRLGNISQLQYLGTSKLLIDDRATHAVLPEETGDGTRSHRL